MRIEDLDVFRFRERLLAWFDESRRDLPWRRTTDPYRIWVSEVMLQQTQVERVVGYFERFLSAFPTVHSLAAASLDDVLRRWEGLGYYARARALHAAAGRLVDDHGARLPASAAGLRMLPGFGAYTSAAVASIAFGEPIAALDTNVVRVLARVGTIDGPIRRSPARDEVERLAAALLDPSRPGDFNQAMMELGATVCRPRAPRCLLCPVADYCRARACGDPERWPSAVERAPKPDVVAACGIVRRRGRLLVVRRPDRGLLGGLWEFPATRLGPDESLESACVRGVREATGLAVATGPAVAALSSSFSHFRLTVHAFSCNDLGGRAASGRWATPEEAGALPLTRTARTVLDRLAGERPTRRRA